jgi:hypothetical protein
MAPFRVLTKVLDKSHPTNVKPGMVVIANMDVIDRANLKRGDIVVAHVFDRTHKAPYATVIREFVPPDFLATTSSGPNEIVALDDPENEFRFVIIGLVRHQHLSLRRGDGS